MAPAQVCRPKSVVGFILLISGQEDFNDEILNIYLYLLQDNKKNDSNIKNFICRALFCPSSSRFDNKEVHSDDFTQSIDCVYIESLATSAIGEIMKS